MDSDKCKNQYQTVQAVIKDVWLSDKRVIFAIYRLLENIDFRKNMTTHTFECTD